MNLTDTQVAIFEDEGYLFLPGLFSAAEVGVLNDAAAEIYACDREEVWRESSGVARTAFAAREYDEAHRRLAAHPRLIKPIEQILDGKLICTNTRSTPKPPSTARFGNGIRILAPGTVMTACRRRGR